MVDPQERQCFVMSWLRQGGELGLILPVHCEKGRLSGDSMHTIPYRPSLCLCVQHSQFTS